jgi:LPS export ABC transporter protein LptC
MTGGKGWRWILGLAVVALLGAGAYIAGSGPHGAAGPADPNEADTAAYAFEANAVIVRQTDEEGHLLYRLQAAHVAQLPSEGAISADDLSMHYDPPEAPADGSQRWTLTAQAARLPESSDIVELHGQVRASGRLEGSPLIATYSTERMDYNLKTQDIATDAPVELQWGGNRVTSESGLRANIKQSTWALESDVHGHIVP